MYFICCKISAFSIPHTSELSANLYRFLPQIELDTLPLEQSRHCPHCEGNLNRAGIMHNIYFDQNRLVMYRGVIEKPEQVVNSEGLAFNRAVHDITAKVLTDANHAKTDQIMNLGLTMLKKVNPSFSLEISEP